jgi:hypothetical protein
MHQDHPAADMPDADSLTRAALRGDLLPWPADAADIFAQDFLELADFHGVKPLLHHRLHEAANTPDWPARVIDDLKTSAMSYTAWEMVHQREISRVLRVFDDAGITPLVMKGSALAYSHYPAPAVRARCDTDLLVAPDSREVADRLFIEAGFTKGFGVTGEYISYESAYFRSDSFGFDHTFDLHWRVNNAQVLAKLFRYADLLERTAPVPELDERAKGLCPVDALLLACLHRAAHMGHTTRIGNAEYSEGNRLIWLYDIHLLLSAMSSVEQEEFTARALKTGLGRVCLDALETGEKVLGTPLPPEVQAALSRSSPAQPAARYLRSGPVMRTWIDLRSHPCWRDRLGYLKELFFPSEAYMRQKYPEQHTQSLTWLYIARALSGIRKRLNR